MGGYPAAGYPAAPGYPAAGYPGQPMGAPVGSGSGGLLGTLGSALGAAALGTAILNPVSVSFVLTHSFIRILSLISAYRHLRVA